MRTATRNIAILYLSVLLLARLSDVATNPGSDVTNVRLCSQNDSKYPCSYCHQEVTWSNIMSLMCINLRYNTMLSVKVLEILYLISYHNPKQHGTATSVIFKSLDTLTDTSDISLSLDSASPSALSTFWKLNLPK